MLGKVIYSDKANPLEWESFYGNELRPYAVRNFKGFVAVLYFLITEKQANFDLMVGAGDSGSAVAFLAELVFRKCQKPCPKIIRIPVLRYNKPDIYWSDKKEDFFDNKALIPQIRDQLKNLEKFENILYVDDETGYGLTFRTISNYLVDTSPKNTKLPLNFTVVAEDFGFNWEGNESIHINFYPFSTGYDGLYNVISYIVPYETELEIRKVFPEKELGPKAILSILLNLPVKNLTKPEFNYDALERAKREVKNFSNLQTNFLKLVEQMISDGIKDYIDGKTRVEESLGSKS